MLSGEDTRMADWLNPTEGEEYDPYDLKEMFRRELERDKRLAQESCCMPDLGLLLPRQEPEPLLLKVDLTANTRAAEFVKSQQQPDDDTEERTRKRKATAQADGVRMSRRADYNALETSLPMPESPTDELANSTERLTTDSKYVNELNQAAVRTRKRLDEICPPPSNVDEAVKHCSLKEWRETNKSYAEQLDKLEGALLRFTHTDQAWKAAMIGEGNGDAFAPGHPCANLPDATRLTLAKLDSLDPTAYIKSIEMRFRFSLNVSSMVATALVKEESDSITTNYCTGLLPSLDHRLLHGVINDRFVHGAWRVVLPFEDPETPKNADKLHYLHANSVDLALVARHTHLFKAISEPLIGPHIARDHSTLVGLDALGDHILRVAMHREETPYRKFTYWRYERRLAPFLAAMIARLSRLPIPTLEQLGDAGKWWLGSKDECLQARSIRHHIAYSRMAKVLAARVNAALHMPAVDDLRKANGMSELCKNTYKLTEMWFNIRLVRLPILYHLYASWTAYMFGPMHNMLEYLPMSFANRSLDTEAPAVRQVMEHYKIARGEKQGTDWAKKELAQNMLLRMDVWYDKRAATPAARGSHEIKRLLPRDHRYSVWHPNAGDPRYGEERLFTAEAITVASFFRGYLRHTEEMKIQPQFVNSGPVLSAVATTVTEAIQRGRRMFFPPEVYTETIHNFLDECLDTSLTKDIRPWTMGRDLIESLDAAARKNLPPEQQIQRTTSDRITVFVRDCKELFRATFEAKKTAEVPDSVGIAQRFTFVQATEHVCREYLSVKANVTKLKCYSGARLPSEVSGATILRSNLPEYHNALYVFIRRVKT